MSNAAARKSPTQSLRSLRDIKDWHALIAIASFVLFFFRDILFQQAYFWEDFLYYFYPVRNFAAVSVAAGELPLWNPFTFNGMPFQADIQTALFYLPNLLLTLFVRDGQLSFYWLEIATIAHYVVAAVCMFLLMRSFGFERPYAFFSGLVYGLSGFMIVHAIHHVVISQVAWLPLIVLLFRNAMLRRSVAHTVAGGLVLGHSVLAGFPQLSLYIFFFLFLYFLFEYIVSLKLGGFIASTSMLTVAAGTIVLALGVTALQLLPTIELSSLSQRAEITYEKSLEGSLTLGQLVTLVMPTFYGASSAQGSTYWGAGAHWHYWETCTYIGIPALVFTIVGITLIRRDRYVAFFFGILLFALLYALGDSFVLHKLFFHVVPGFSTFRNPGRMALLFSFAAAFLSAHGLRATVEWMLQDRKKFQRLIYAVGVGGVLVWIFAHLGFLQPPAEPQVAEQISGVVTEAATTAVVLALLVCGVLIAGQKKVFSGTVCIVLFALLQFIDLHIFGFDQNNSSLNPDSYFRRAGALVTTLKEEGEVEYFRINSRRGGAMILDRNQGMIDRLFLMEGYTPLVLQRLYPAAKDWDMVCAMLNVKYRIDVNEERRTMGLSASDRYLPRAYVVYQQASPGTEEAVENFMKSEDFDPWTTVVLDEPLPVAPMDTTTEPEWGASITHYSLNEITVEVSTSHDGILVLSEVYYPGWKAYVDGRQEEISRANWNLRAIPLTAGMHTVEFRFKPRPFRIGLWISTATLVVSVVLVFGARGFRRKTKQPLP